MKITMMDVQLQLLTLRAYGSEQGWPEAVCASRCHMWKKIRRLEVHEWKSERNSANVEEISPPGALPITTLPTPLYIPRNPPELKKPCADCSRVFTVSNG